MRTKRLSDMLVEMNLITKEQLQQALKIQKEEHDRLKDMGVAPCLISAGVHGSISQRLAHETGYITILEDAEQLVDQGITTVDEVMRTITGIE